jgi:hypothetical protein
MPKEKTIDRAVRIIQSSADIEPHVVLRVCNELGRNVIPHEQLYAREWAALIKHTRHVRRSLTGNRHQWNVDAAPLYAEYVGLMDAVLARIQAAQLTYASIEQCTNAARQRAADKGLIGQMTKLRGPTVVPYTLPEYAQCNKQWPTWIPPRVIADFLLRLEAHYALKGLKGSVGKRLRPFTTVADCKAVDERAKNLSTALRRMRSLYVIGGNDKAYAHRGDTPYKALMLTAMRQAERTLERIQSELRSGVRPYWDSQVPVDWRALCEPAMRQRLRDADKHPENLTLDGLGDYYAAPRDGGADESDRSAEVCALLEEVGLPSGQDDDDDAFWHLGETR